MQFHTEGSDGNGSVKWGSQVSHKAGPAAVRDGASLGAFLKLGGAGGEFLPQLPSARVRRATSRASGEEPNAGAVAE